MPSHFQGYVDIPELVGLRDSVRSDAITGPPLMTGPSLVPVAVTVSTALLAPDSFIIHCSLSLAVQSLTSLDGKMN
jgi:hypothetical protein